MAKQQNLLGRAIVYTVPAALEPGAKPLPRNAPADQEGGRRGRAALTVIGGVEHHGSTWHPDTAEFCGRVTDLQSDGKFVIEVLVPGPRIWLPAEWKQIKDVELGEGPGRFRLLSGPLPGWGAVYRSPAEDTEQVTVGDKTRTGCSLHSSMTCFAAIGVLVRSDGRADLEVIVPSDNGKPWEFGPRHTWVCNIERGEGPGRYQPV